MTQSLSDAPAVPIAERRAWAINGFLPALVVLALFIAPIGWFVSFFTNDTEPPTSVLVVGVVAILLAVTVASGLDVIQPGATKVVQFFGRYVGTVRATGFILTVPFSQRSLISIRVSNFETSELKVNDAEGNPVNIAAIIVWQVQDTAKALFAVEDYADFVRVQSESALRHVAMSHPYDHPSEGTTSLRGATEQVALEIAQQVQDRVALAGVHILEARISKLAYAPEIAQAMLQRQQAGAILAARERIVDGAVGMVQAALQRLERDDIVALDDERKAAMVSNLLVILCGDSRATPIVNTGTLYS
ncbi:MAG TPA: SPFH domain-containing protein [Microbacteriaceae bacterium]|nr:SPFH domain-containing protein [Microbacteriaceae bacterium]